MEQLQEHLSIIRHQEIQLFIALDDFLQSTQKELTTFGLSETDQKNELKKLREEIQLHSDIAKKYFSPLAFSANEIRTNLAKRGLFAVLHSEEKQYSYQATSSIQFKLGNRTK